MKLSDYIQSNPVSICEVDQDGKVNRWDQATSILRGYPEKDMIGRSFIEFVPVDEDKSVFRNWLERVFIGEAVEPVRISFRRADNEQRQLLMNATGGLQGEDGLGGATLTGLDVTELLSILGQQDEIRTIRYGELDTSHSALYGNGDKKNINANSFKHRLLTPLNSLLGFVELLSCGFYGPLNAKQEEYVRQIDKSGHQVLSVINELLEEKSGNGEPVSVKVGEVEPKAFVYAAKKMLDERFNARGIDLILDYGPILPVIIADFFKSRQVLVGLLMIVLRFMAPGGWVKVTVSRENDYQIRCLVSYHGINSSVFRESEIFALGSGIDASGHVESVELATISEWISRMGGKEIRATFNSTNCGMFWFCLGGYPDVGARDGKVAEVSAAIINARPSDDQLIMIVEDDEANLVMITAMLSTRGYSNIVIARNGREAIEKASQCRPDIILMDILMPVMGGIDATRHLRDLPEIVDVPIIGVTACVDKDTIQELQDAGCNDWLAKPIAANALFSLLVRYLGNGHPDG